MADFLGTRDSNVALSRDNANRLVLIFLRQVIQRRGFSRSRKRLDQHQLVVAEFMIHDVILFVGQSVRFLPNPVELFESKFDVVPYVLVRLHSLVIFP